MSTLKSMFLILDLPATIESAFSKATIESVFLRNISSKINAFDSKVTIESVCLLNV